MISQEKQKPSKTPSGPRGKPESVAFENLHLSIFPDVYDPHEDSFMLAKAAKELSFGKVLDLGCGSGIGGLLAIQNKKVTEITFADISDSALANARQNYEKNERIIAQSIGMPKGNQAIKSNPKPNRLPKPNGNPKSNSSSKPNAFFIKSNLFQKLENVKFDTILFNPPYLPTTNEEQLGGNINRAFDGGKNGRQTIAKFLLKFQQHLSQKGILLFLDSSLSDSIKTEKKLSSLGFKFEVLSLQSFFFEKLRVLKVYR
ncbi:MAG: HemK2/MTQ2 family protein methyltransferase [Candidatus Micrarchaeota archaeon]